MSGFYVFSEVRAGDWGLFGDATACVCRVCILACTRLELVFPQWS